MTVWMCALTDCAGENFWTGKGFVSADEWQEYADGIPFFASQALAEAEARRLRDEHEIYLATKWVNCGHRFLGPGGGLAKR
jgi:hypothetical protein